ncbi:MAG: recombinase family protein [Candidatus Obscuribacterales bacterium]|nr:recombinase family protein [Candidatus Obscuribacterales bacterium]
MARIGGHFHRNTHIEPAGLESCLKALRKGDPLLVWKLDRLARDLTHLVKLIDELHERDVPLKVKGQWTSIDTTTAEGKLVFGSYLSACHR